MNKICKLSDLSYLNLPKEYKNHLAKYFKELHQSLENDLPLEEFSLKKHGPITLLNGAVDINKENLLHSSPEFIERLILNRKYIYRIFILRNNDYMDIYYLSNDDFSPEVKDWLEDYTAYDWKLKPSEDTDIPF